MVVTLTSDAKPVENLRAVCGAVQDRPKAGDPANVIVVPDLSALSLGTLRALALILEDPFDHVRIYRDQLALQPITEEEVLAELHKRPVW